MCIVEWESCDRCWFSRRSNITRGTQNCVRILRGAVAYHLRWNQELHVGSRRRPRGLASVSTQGAAIQSSGGAVLSKNEAKAPTTIVRDVKNKAQLHNRPCVSQHSTVYFHPDSHPVCSNSIPRVSFYKYTYSAFAGYNSNEDNYSWSKLKRTKSCRLRIPWSSALHCHISHRYHHPLIVW